MLTSDDFELKEFVQKEVVKYFDEFISKIIKNEFGYYSEKNGLDCAEIIGKKLIKKNIKFESNFDVGYAEDFIPGGKWYETDKKFAKKYVLICKKTPNKFFLKDKINPIVQKEILLKILEKVDLENLVFSEFHVVSSVRMLLKSGEDVGINHLLINKEVTDLIMKKYCKEKFHINMVICFIHDGFGFKDEIMNDIKQDYFKTFAANQNDEWKKLEATNHENKINANYLHLSLLMPSINEDKCAKLKI